MAVRIHEALPFRRERGKRSTVRKAPRGRQTVMKEGSSPAPGKGEGKEHGASLRKYHRIGVVWERVPLHGPDCARAVRPTGVQVGGGKNRRDHVHLLLRVAPRTLL